MEGSGHRALRNWQVNQPIFDGRGTWQERLSPEEQALFSDPAFRELMVHFGYPDPVEEQAASS